MRNSTLENVIFLTVLLSNNILKRNSVYPSHSLYSAKNSVHYVFQTLWDSDQKYVIDFFLSNMHAAVLPNLAENKALWEIAAFCHLWNNTNFEVNSDQIWCLL